MKLLSAIVTNFSSYSHLSFSYDKKLLLVQGATGSGKSTLFDIPTWIMFGQTAKGGKVDDVRKWGESEETYGSLVVELNSGDELTIVRTRGAKNDLLWTINGGDDRRGKDLADSQAKLNDILGIDFESYSLGAYFSEFSIFNTFFLGKAKERRLLLNRIIDLSFCEDLAEKLTTKRKELKVEIAGLQRQVDLDSNTMSNLTSEIEDLRERFSDWNTNKITSIEELQHRSKTFAADIQSQIQGVELQLEEIETQQSETYLELSGKLLKYKKELRDLGNKADIAAEIERLESESVCTVCGSTTKKNQKRVGVLNQILYKIDSAEKQIVWTQQNIDALKRSDRGFPLKDKIADLKSRTNTYDEQIKNLEQSENPFDSILSDKGRLLDSNIQKAAKNYEVLRNAEANFSDIQTLTDLVPIMTSKLLEDCVKFLETTTNAHLERYFDSEIRVYLSMPDTDKLELRIEKDGNECSYAQLSKGQRCLLKLCFGVAVMRQISDHTGTKFENLFFDEALDGLDSVLKVKAYQLFSELSASHSSVMLIDHSTELQQMVPDKIRVELVDDESVIDGA